MGHNGCVKSINSDSDNAYDSGELNSNGATHSYLLG